MNESEIVTIKLEQAAVVQMAACAVQGTRPYQQDTYYITNEKAGSLSVICDGMGGMEHGEWASQRSVELLISDFEAVDKLDNPSQFLYQEAMKMDALVAAMQEEGRSCESGTTLIAVLIIGGNAYWVSVGDSRIYLGRNEEMIPVNRSHNYALQLNEQFEKDEITLEEYQKNMDKGEALISYIGMDGIELIDINRVPFQLEKGDRFLLCSDGLYKAINEKEISKIVLDTKLNSSQVVEQLLEKVKNSGRKHLDNTTLIAISYE